MKVAITGQLPSEQHLAFERSCNQQSFSWVAVQQLAEIAQVKPDLVIMLECNGPIPALPGIPILINETVRTCAEIAPGVQQVARFCGWPSFLERTKWEVAPADPNHCDWLAAFEQALNRDFTVVKDIPGLVAPRILATIVNEACFGLADAICNKAAMDIAMKLGTNYPKGPMEWMEIVGKEKFAKLLSVLAIEDDRYQPHPLLLNQP